MFIASSVLIITEITFICLFPFIFSQDKMRKYPLWLTLLLVIGIGIILASGLIALLLTVGLFSNTNGYLFLLVYIFVPILNLLYKTELKKVFVIVSFSLLYASICFFISAQVSDFFKNDNLHVVEENSAYIIFIGQTLCYLVTFPLIMRFVKGKLQYMLNVSNKLAINILTVSTFIWILVFFVMNFSYSFSRETNTTATILRFVLSLLLVAGVITVYALFFMVATSDENVKNWQKIAKIDYLTGLGNRQAAQEAVEKRINGDKKFAFIMLDLDNFKLINDRYGHSEGDHYLVSFAKTIVSITGNKGEAYRMSGDEFFIIYDDLNTFKRVCHKIEKIDYVSGRDNIEFLGVSLGYATAPEEGTNLDMLIHNADKMLYLTKNGKEMIRYRQ